MKILCVEDGSVDVDAIERDDLKEGRVLIYRQGATPPFVLDIPEGEGVWKGVEGFCKRANDMATEPYKQEIAVLEQELNDWRDGTIIVKLGEAEEKCKVLEKALELLAQDYISFTDEVEITGITEYFIKKAKEELE